MKYFNFKRYKFAALFKNVNFRKYNFYRIPKFLDLRKVLKYVSIRKFEYTRFFKYFNFRSYNINRLTKKISLKSNKTLLTYILTLIPLSIFLYLLIPVFYNYDKSNIENLICENKKVDCVIKGKVRYNFFPTPRIKVKDLIIINSVKKKETLITASDLAIKLSLKNLLTKEKQLFKKIELNNFEFNLNLQNYEYYKKIFQKKVNFIPIDFKKGKIILLDGNNYVSSINDSEINLKFLKDSALAVIKGNFLDDDLYIKFNRENKIVDIIIKMKNLNLLTKTKFNISEKDKNIENANILIKKDKVRFAGVFDYRDNEIEINKSNLKNIFFNGDLEGKIKILPYFYFDLDLSLSNINFTKLYNHFLKLNENDQKKLFKINKKINGKLNLSADKVYSSYNLVKSFESQSKFNNGNIIIEQFLINLGKLGAADILGEIRNDRKFTNFVYESNIFVDNQKKFLSKFDIYDRKSISSNFFVSGNFDLENVKISIYEISGNEQLNKEDVNFVETEFNDLVLEEGYKNLFRFPKFKEFIKLITSDQN